MKKIFALWVLIGLANFVSAQENTSLKKYIDSLYESDQQEQWTLKRLIENNAPIDSIERQEKIKKQVFERNIPLIKDIYARYGYPTIQLVGKESSKNFFVLIQHADSDVAFQKSMLPILKRHAEKGSIALKDYAYLYDRVHRNMGGKQLYGTQLTFNKNGSLFDKDNKISYPPDLDDPAGVDKRRKKMGLEPLETYYESVLSALGKPRKNKQ